MRRFDRGCAGAFASCAMVALLLAHAYAPPAAAQGRPRGGARSGELIPGGPRVGLDDRFRVARGLDIAPSFLEALDDGTGEFLYAAGGFVTADGAVVNGLARWDGERWEGVGDGSIFTRGGRRTAVLEAMAFFDDGSGTALYVGGGFDRVGDVEAKGIAKWDGESWSEVGEGFLRDGEPWRVDALVVFDDGVNGARLIAGGGFDESGGVAVNALAMLDGDRWSSMPSTNTVRLLTGIGSLIGAPIRDMTMFLEDGQPRLAVALADGADIANEDGTAGGGRVIAWDGVRWSGLISQPASTPIGVPFQGVVECGTLMTNDAGELFIAGQVTSQEFIPSLNRSLRVSAVVARWTGERWAAAVSSNGQASAALRVVARPAGGGEEYFFILKNGPADLHGSTPHPTIQDLPFQLPIALGLLREESAATFLFAEGRRSRSEMAIDPASGDLVVALGQFQASPDRAATSVVRLEGEFWRTVGGADGAGLGANSTVGALILHDDGGGSALHAAGRFSVLGGEEGAFAARFADGAWHGLGQRIVGADIYDPIGLISLDANNGDRLVAAAPTRPTTGGDQRAFLQWTGEQWAPLDIGGGAIERASGAKGSHGEVERIFALVRLDGPPFRTVVEFDGTTVTELAAPFDPFTPDLRFRPLAVVGDDHGSTVVVITPDLDPASGELSPGASWDGMEWSRLPSDDPLAPFNVNSAASFARDGRTILVTAG